MTVRKRLQNSKFGKNKYLNPCFDFNKVCASIWADILPAIRNTCICNDLECLPCKYFCFTYFVAVTVHTVRNASLLYNLISRSHKIVQFLQNARASAFGPTHSIKVIDSFINLAVYLIKGIRSNDELLLYMKKSISQLRNGYFDISINDWMVLTVISYLRGGWPSGYAQYFAELISIVRSLRASIMYKYIGVTGSDGMFEIFKEVGKLKVE